MQSIKKNGLKFFVKKAWSNLKILKLNSKWLFEILNYDTSTKSQFLDGLFLKEKCLGIVVKAISALSLFAAEFGAKTHICNVYGS